MPNKNLPYFDTYPVPTLSEADYIKVFSVSDNFTSWFTVGKKYRLKKDAEGKLYVRDDNNLKNYSFSLLTDCKYYSANPIHKYDHTTNNSHLF